MPIPLPKFDSDPGDCIEATVIPNKCRYGDIPRHLAVYPALHPIIFIVHKIQSTASTCGNPTMISIDPMVMVQFHAESGTPPVRGLVINGMALPVLTTSIATIILVINRRYGLTSRLSSINPTAVRIILPAIIPHNLYSHRQRRDHHRGNAQKQGESSGAWNMPLCVWAG